MSKIYDEPAAALQGLLFDGMTVMSGGFGLSGNPESLIPVIRAAGVTGLTVISNNAGADGFGARIETLIAAMLADEGVRLPGAKRDAQSARAGADGLEIPDAVLEKIKALATP